METSLKEKLVTRLKQVGSYEVRVADPHAGFEHALEEKHPLNFWPACRSVIVYAVPMSPEMINLYVGPFSRWDGDPKLGNRMILGAILTDALLEPDPRLENFNPCKDCDICIRACPANAYDPEKEYPDSWSREKCMAKRTEIVKKGLFCHNCFASCPAGRLKDDELFLKREAASFFKPDREISQW